MDRLNEDTLRLLHRHGVTLGLHERRSGLMAGISQAFTSMLPIVASPSEQLLCDMNALNDAGQLTDGTVPIVQWLRNVLSLMGARKEAGEFERALQLLNPVERSPRAVKRGGVAVDFSHQQQEWHQLRTSLHATTWPILELRDRIAADSLRSAAVLIVAPPRNAVFSREELDAIEDWVLAGGGLFALGHYAADTHHMGRPSDLARRFGFQFGNDLLLPSERGTERNARTQVWALDPTLAVHARPQDGATHPLLRDVTDVAFLSSCTVESTSAATNDHLLFTQETTVCMRPKGHLTPDGFMPAIDEWAVDHSGSAAVLGACQHGQGRVVVAGGWKLFTLKTADNQKLLENAIRWLGEAPTEERDGA
ncbi:MAG: hypothetical protein U0441_25690 [Polyangiaceae bacterium]